MMWEKRRELEGIMMTVKFHESQKKRQMFKTKHKVLGITKIRNGTIEK